MAFYIIPQRYQVRGETAEVLYGRNEVLMAREQCFETDTGRGKLGDGNRPYNSLLFTAYGYADLTGLANGQSLVWEEDSSGEGIWVPGTPSSTPGGGLSGSIGATFDGGGAELAVASFCDVLVPFDCTIDSVTILADPVGDIVIDVWSDSFGNYPPTNADSITASATPEIYAGLKRQDTTLTGWTTTLSAGTTLRFSIESVADITKATIQLQVTRS